MNGGMRIDPKELPLRHQEQLAAAILAQITQAAPVAVREEECVKKKLFARRLIFVNDRAARRYRILRKQEESGAIRDLVMQKNKHGEIYKFTYVIVEVY